ncbi:MAG: hypothetical protein K8I27_13840 [Planctomycetes bacterium]|nr:hypothetical protein [Planctomycetota bacterium]
MRKAFDLRPLVFSDVLGRSFSLYTSNFVPLLRWFAIFWLVPMLATAVLFYFALDPYDWVAHRHLEKPSLVEPNRYAAYHWLLSLAAVLFAFTTGAAGIYFVAARTYVGDNPGFGDLMRAVQKRFGHVAGVGFLHVLVIAGWTLFCWASPFLLWEGDEEGMAILVGFVLWCAWLPVLLWYLGTWGLNTAVPLLDDAEATEAFGRSRFLTKGFRMRLAGVFVLVTLAVGAPGIPGLLTVPGLIATSMLGDNGYPLIGQIVGLAWDAVLLPLFFIPVVVYYFDMRCRKESYDLTVMALNFGINEQELARYRFNPGVGYFPEGWKGNRSRARAHVRMPLQRAPQQRQAQMGVSVPPPGGQWGAAQPLPGQWAPPPQIPSSQWGPPMQLPPHNPNAPRFPNGRGPARP